MSWRLFYLNEKTKQIKPLSMTISYLCFLTTPLTYFLLLTYRIYINAPLHNCTLWLCFHERLVCLWWLLSCRWWLLFSFSSFYDCVNINTRSRAKIHKHGSSLASQQTDIRHSRSTHTHTTQHRSVECMGHNMRNMPCHLNVDEKKKIQLVLSLSLSLWRQTSFSDQPRPVRAFVMYNIGFFSLSLFYAGAKRSPGKFAAWKYRHTLIAHSIEQYIYIGVAGQNGCQSEHLFSLHMLICFFFSIRHSRSFARRLFILFNAVA